MYKAALLCSFFVLVVLLAALVLTWAIVGDHFYAFCAITLLLIVGLPQLFVWSVDKTLW